MRVAALAVCAALAVGCRATPTTAVSDMSSGDMAAPGGGGDDGGMGDLAVGPDMVCPVGPEICGNGCDDDRNGYTDDDDPACTTQVLVTLQVSTPQLDRLILEPTPHVVALDGNVVQGGGMAMYNAALAPGVAFAVYDGSGKRIERRPVGGTPMAAFNTTFGTRDACAFNGELIVVEPFNGAAGGGLLHRFKPDGQTAIGTPVNVPNYASACTSDGKQLFVATHSASGPSTIEIYSASANGPVDTGVALAIPDALANDGYVRLIDFAYLKKSGLFLGLFAQPTAADSLLNSQVMAPFGLDGGSGAYVDGGVWHGVGEFLP